MTFLLLCPTEILLKILSFAATDSAAPQTTLLNVSLTCSSLHHVVFCSENDSLWRGPAVSLGIPESLTLDKVLYPGSSTLQRRLWRNVVKLNSAWSRPFPAGTPALPKTMKAALKLPPQNKEGDWFGRRTIEAFASGEGNRKGPYYWTKHTNVQDDGCAVFQVKTQKVAVGSKVRYITGILDPVLGRSREIISERRQSREWTATPFPVATGFILEEKNEEFRIRAIDASIAKFSRCWNLGRRKPDRFVANGDLLVAVTFDPPDKEAPGFAPHIPSNLVCLKSVKSEVRLWKRELEESEVVWEFDVCEEWAEEEHYTCFPHLKNFHMTRTHVVCLVTRHPTSTLGKLTGTNFLILSLSTGKTVKALKFNTKTSSTLAGTGLRAAFTTAFSHDFLLTDTYIVSGGAGGGLLVWDYSSDAEGPIYMIPDPFGSDATKIDGAATAFPRQYSALTLSVDGRYVAATTSDKLWIFDIVSKRIESAWSNGRKIDKKDYYVKNPIDDFQPGAWCWWKEWRSRREEETGEVTWEEVEGAGGVGYLTGLGGEGGIVGSRLKGLVGEGGTVFVFTAMAALLFAVLVMVARTS